MRTNSANTTRALVVACLIGVLGLAGCATHQAYRKAQRAEQIGDWDEAVIRYLELTNRYPDRIDYRAGLLRSKLRASQSHFETGKQFLGVGALERAFSEFQQAVQLDPTNQYAQVEMEKLREQLLLREEERSPLGTIKEMKERASGTRPQPPVLQPRSQEPISLEFPNQVSVFDIYKSLGRAFGINILFDPKMRDQQIAIELQDVIAQDALEILMRTAGHFYKVLDEQSIIVAEDNPQNRRNYEDLVIQTFFLSNAETKDVLTILRSLVGTKNVAESAQLNAIVLRDTADKVKVAERIIETIDKSRGEVVVDVELLQINTSFLQDIGLTLSEYSVTQTLEQPGSGADGGPGGIRVSDIEFINQSSWFLALPSFTYNFIKSSGEAELLASPQLRISDGETANLVIGDSVPIPVTSFNTGNLQGNQVVPLTSFQYRDVGIRLDIEPRIHHNREVSLKLTVEVSNLGESIQSGQQTQPVIQTRTIESTIRLKNGETNFLAGLIQDVERRSDVGLPGLSDIPLIGRLFSNKRTDNMRTDLVLTLTPHIIRTPDITETDLLPIWVGTEANITFRGGSPRVESDVEGPFDQGQQDDAERIREMIRRRIQNLPRGLQNESGEQQEEQQERQPGVDLTPNPFGRDGGGDGGGQASTERSIIFVPSGLDLETELAAAELALAELEAAAAASDADDAGVEPSSAFADPPQDTTVSEKPAEPIRLPAPVELRFAPNPGRASVGEELTIEITVASTDAVSHLPLEISFDSDRLTVVAVEDAGFLGGGDRSRVLADYSDPGKLVLGASRLGKGRGVVGNGAVARVVFRADKAGTTRLRFEEAKALNRNLKDISPVGTRSGRVVIAEGSG